MPITFRRIVSIDPEETRTLLGRKRLTSVLLGLISTALVTGTALAYSAKDALDDVRRCDQQPPSLEAVAYEACDRLIRNPGKDPFPWNLGKYHLWRGIYGYKKNRQQACADVRQATELLRKARKPKPDLIAATRRWLEASCP